MLLFCRLLLAQANLLPAAVKAGSVQAFLDNPELGETDLRDLCLKLEVPTLQDIRDACADFARDEETEAANDAAWETDDEDSDDEGGETWMDLIAEDARYRHLSTDDWFRKKIIGPALDKVDDYTANTEPSKKMQVTICGRSIWNHASEHSMSRHGWLQFSIIAKDCDLKHAVQLCRSWNEFSDLNNLAWWQVFPTANWSSWGGNDLMRQLQQHGFYPYFVDFEAQKYGRRSQVGGRSQLRRQHDIVETRNIVVGHMKRNDPITRRFLQYLLMRTGELLILVRDGKTGRVITAPPKEHLWTYRKKQGLGRASKNEWVNILEMGPDFFQLVNKHRDWRLGFEDYYDIFIWDFVPGDDHMGLYNIIIQDLRAALRITQPRDMYLHMKPIMQTLHRSPVTLRTRPIQPGENVETLWDSVMEEGKSHFVLFDIAKSGNVTTYSPEDLAKSKFIYHFYNEANVLEDQVLFPDEMVERERDNVPFREISNGISQLERGVAPRDARRLARRLEAFDAGEDVKALEESFDQIDLAEDIPKHHVWETGLKQLRRSKPSSEHRKLFNRTGIDRLYTDAWLEELLDDPDPLEQMERERAEGFKRAFHDGDLEPSGLMHYFELQLLLQGMLKTAHAGPTDWIVFIAEMLDWLDTRADHSDYAQEGAAPWPHRYVATDAVEAFAIIAMFFPELEVTSLVTMFLKAPHCKRFRTSDLFKPLERSKTRPDRRSRTSYKFREPQFWSEWEQIMNKKESFRDIYPFDWSLCVRPIIAHLYRAGIIAPAHLETSSIIVSGIATANSEPHRPGKLDLFINYKDRHGNFNLTYPPHFVPPSRWPDLLSLARSFVVKEPAARFALLRLWSAPHFYPLMVGLNMRQPSSFLDSMGRSWEWKFVPKDLPGSEFSVHNTINMRLEMFKKQFGDRVVHRGDLILVMGRDAADLLKYATAVTFVLQTKPWLREVDLHKSFINVGLELLEELEPHWLD